MEAEVLMFIFLKHKLRFAGFTTDDLLVLLYISPLKASIYCGFILVRIMEPILETHPELDFAIKPYTHSNTYSHQMVI